MNCPKCHKEADKLLLTVWGNICEGCRAAWKAEDELNARMEQFSRNCTMAKEAIIKHAAGRRGLRGQTECPICKGDLLYSIAKSNGHVHACCRTNGCVRFME